MLDARSIQFLRHFLTAHPRRTGGMVVLLILAGLAEGVGLMALLPVLDLAVGSDAPGSSNALTEALVTLLQAAGIDPSLGGLLGLIVVAIATKGMLRWVAMKQVGHTVATVAAELRLRLIRAIVRARWQHVVDRPNGSLSNAISYEARRAAWAYKRACSAFADAVQVIMYLTVAMFVSWRVALLAPLVGGGLVYALRGLVQASRVAGEDQTAAMEAMVDRFGELVPNIKPVKAMAREASLLSLIESEVQAYNDAERQAVSAYEAMDAFREPLIVLVIAAGLYGALTVAQMTFSVVLTLALILYRLMTAVGHLQQKYQKMAHGESAFWSLMRKIEAAESAVEPTDGAVPSPPLDDALTLDNVTVGYDDTPVLRDVTLRLPAGRFIAVEGASGAGKTTLVDLLTGMLRPASGEVCVDGTPLADVDLTRWRQRIGYVPQELLLLNDTIYRNVVLGDETISRERAAQALRDAGAWSFVDSHPEGMDRVVGERGGQVSGGQGQRIMIARALVHSPQLLLLDEATTGVDPATERAIYRTLQALKGRLTVVSISHQPAMREAADLLVEVGDGTATLRVPATSANGANP